MKKFGILLMILCLALATFAASITLGSSASAASITLDSSSAESFADEISECISAESLRDLTERICTEIPDRTSFTPACKEAAEKLIDYIGRSGGLNTEIQTFTQTVTVMSGLSYVSKDITSYNITATPKEPDPNKKTVLITTNLGNHYSENAAGSGVKAPGALYNAASLALTIGLANYFSMPEQAAACPYNVSFAFFSGTDEGNFGSYYFMENNSLGDVILVLNLERIGCGTTFYYTDEAETEHGKFIRELAKDTSLREFPTAGRVLLDMSTVDGLPYSHYAMRGDISTFLTAGKSCLELIGGEFNGLTDGEGGSKRLTNTSDDTYENLVAVYPDFADNLKDAADFAVSLINKSELKDVCLGAATSYKVFATPWIGYVIGLGIIMILILIMILVLGVLERKYPLPKAPKVKLAVFGREFEDPNEDEIVVDFGHEEKHDNNVDPFNL